MKLLRLQKCSLNSGIFDSFRNKKISDSAQNSMNFDMIKNSNTFCCFIQKFLTLFLMLIFSSALICNMAYAKQAKGNAKAYTSAKSKKAVSEKSKKAGTRYKKNVAYKLKPVETRVKNFFFAAYDVIRNMGYSRNESINGAFAYTLHCWRESNMHGQGVAKWLYQKYGVINPAHISVPAEWKGVWKHEWDNGRRVRKKWAAWTTYNDAAKGTIEYIKRNHPKAFRVALKGNINAYANIISNSNYHSGDPREYKRVLIKCMPIVKRMIEKVEV